MNACEDNSKKNEALYECKLYVLYNKSMV